MIRIEGSGKVAEDRKLVIQLPLDVPPGEHTYIVVLDAQQITPEEEAGLGFPIIHVDHWPANLSLRREDMYDDWGR